MNIPWVLFNCACWFITGYCTHSIKTNCRRIKEIREEIRRLES